MNVQPTLEIHPHQEFHFAENTDSSGCCCFWKSKARKPKEYYVNSRGVLEPFNGTTKKVAARIRANQRLARLVESKFEEDPIENNEAFNKLRKRINYNFEAEKITEEQLMLMVNAIYEVKKEIRNE